MMELYFDHNATTPLSESVKIAMREAMNFYANPSSYYSLNKIPRSQYQPTRPALRY